MELKERLNREYESSAIVKVTFMDSKELAQRIIKRHIRPDVFADGPGYRNRFTGLGIIRIGVFENLVALGFSFSEATKVAFPDDGGFKQTFDRAVIQYVNDADKIYEEREKIRAKSTPETLFDHPEREDSLRFPPLKMLLRRETPAEVGLRMHEMDLRDEHYNEKDIKPGWVWCPALNKDWFYHEIDTLEYEGGEGYIVINLDNIIERVLYDLE